MSVCGVGWPGLSVFAKARRVRRETATVLNEMEQAG